MPAEALSRSFKFLKLRPTFVIDIKTKIQNLVSKSHSCFGSQANKQNRKVQQQYIFFNFFNWLNRRKIKNGIIWDIAPRKSILHAWCEFLYLKVAHSYGTAFQRVDWSICSHTRSFSSSRRMCPIHVFLYNRIVYLGFYLSTVLVNPFFAFCWAPLAASGGSVSTCSSVTLELGTQVGLETMCLGSGLWTSSMDLECGTNRNFISLGLGCLGLFLLLVMVVFSVCMATGSLWASSYPFLHMWSCTGEPGVTVQPMQSGSCC